MQEGPVIVNLKSCRGKVLLERKIVEHAREWERWFGADSVASSAVSEAAPHTTVRIAYVVGVGDI